MGADFENTIPFDTGLGGKQFKHSLLNVAPEDLVQGFCQAKRGYYYVKRVSKIITFHNGNL